MTLTAVNFWWYHNLFTEIARALTQPVVGGVMSGPAIPAMTYNTPRIEEIILVGSDSGPMRPVLHLHLVMAVAMDVEA